MEKRAGDNLIWEGDPHFGDWLSFASTRSDYMGAYTLKDLIATAYFSYSSSIVAKVAEILSKEKDASYYRDLSEKVRLAFNEEFVTSTGRLVSHTQTAYTLALAFDLLDEETADKSAGKMLLKTTKDLIHYSQKVRKNLTEAYRLRAINFWLLNKPNKALKNFNKSIKTAISFDGNLELSRTYFEAGKFLRDSNNKKERINGMNGTECLIKAKSMFEEMNLQWDLKEHEKYLEG